MTQKHNHPPDEDEGGANGLHVEHTDRRIGIFRKGLEPAILTQHAPRGKRPFIHPILAPDGVGELTENEPGHHVWQHGLYVGLNAVNGVGFWTEGRLEGCQDKDGTLYPDPLDIPQLQGDSVRWLVKTEWRSPLGEPMLDEVQRWNFRDRHTAFVLDMSWSLCARADIVFGQYAYGGLFLRMPCRAGAGGRAGNSEGQQNQDAEAKRARWVAVEMPIPGRDRCPESVCSIAMMDHPSNPEHPVPWRVDGDLGVAPSRCIASAWNLGTGEVSHSRYRLLIRCGAIGIEDIEEECQRFANS